jgi:hypothetical protein
MTIINKDWYPNSKGGINTTPKFILIHYGFHYILNEFGHFYHGETNQPPSEQGLVLTNNELVPTKTR